MPRLRFSLPWRLPRRWPYGLLCLATAAWPATALARPALQTLTDPPTLQALEAAGLGLGRWFDARPGADGLNTTAELARQPRWTELRAPLERSVRRIAASDPQAGVGIARHSHRLFDLRWLNSPDAFFELVGVVNRLDREPFHAGRCGETRLVYRLAYRSEAMRSRLPMTVSVELRAEAPDAQGRCSAAAQRWAPPPSATHGAALARWLMSDAGALAPARLERTQLAQIAVNLQSVRWPSGVRPDLGGHAEYLLRAYRWNATAGRYEPGPLENTPDAARLRRDAALRAELKRWLQAPAQMQALDQGTLQLPERFLAQESRSVTPRGLERQANRPFAQIFSEADWQPVPGSRTVASAAAVLRRLDDLSCAGCHQSRAVAGFHLLGEDAPGTRTFTAGNAVALAQSPHAVDETARRSRYAAALLDGREPDPFRPLAEGGGPDGAEGAACGLGDAGFAAWQCADGLRCLAQQGPPAARSPVGVCVPDIPVAGSLCEPTRLSAHADPTQDRAQRLPRLACGPSAPQCERTAVGFPGGMCSAGCTPGAGGAPEGATCGRIAVLDDFNACLAARRPFAQCLGHTRPGLLRSCSATQACRDDYICAQSEGAAPGHGACMPPYFLFQMRVDGHP